MTEQVVEQVEETQHEPFKTDDTTLATFLSLHINPIRYEWEDRACFWYFPSSENLKQLVTQFAGGEARVEPRQYSSNFSKRKKELYQAQQQHRNKKSRVTRAEGES